ncbi:hypothetical protein Tco_0364236 [Tanacetum coccineum]
MAALESCPKHNMIAYLEKTDRNTKFHEIMDFLTRSSIYYTLTVSPVVSTTFFEQFWMSAKSKTINNVRYITATVAGKPVTISKALIRSDLLFDDVDGIDTLNNQAVFDTIQLMGHLVAKKKFVMYPRFISVFFATQLKNFPVPLDHFPINGLTSKDEGEALERPFEPQPIPSHPHPSKDQPKSQPDLSLRPSPSIPIPDSNPEGSSGNHGGQSSSDRSLSGNEDGLTLQSVYDLCISLCKQGGKLPNLNQLHKDQAFDDPDDFGPIDYMETEDAHNEKGVSTEDQVSTVKPDEGTDKPKVSTDKIDEGTAELKNGNLDENATPTATLIVFGDDETIAEFLVSMSQNKAKQKLVEIKDAEDSNRPRPTSTRSLLTLKPLPKIDPKDKGKTVLEEEAEMVQEEWETEEKNKKLAEEEATKVALIRDYDDIQARIEANSILAARLQEEEREKFTIEERAKLLHDTIAAQRRFLA